MILFDYRSGILEAADANTGREWCWFKGDAEITRTVEGVLASSLSVPAEASVVAIKSLIRQDAKR